jgi:hypothetical protein
MGRRQPTGGAEPVVIAVTARRSWLLSPAVATTLGALVLMVGVGSAVLNSIIHPRTTAGDVLHVAVISIYVIVGVVVARHQPRNPVGWALLAGMFLFVLSLATGDYAVLHYRLGHAGLPLAPAAVVLQPSWAPAVALFALVIFLFPDGRLASPHWRQLLWAYGGLVAVAAAAGFVPAVGAVLHHDVHLDLSGDVITATSNAAASVVVPVVVLLIGVIWLSFVAYQFLNWQRSAGERRQQFKWLLWGAAITLAGGVVGSVFNSNPVANLMFAGIVALPVGIGIGILKYRLYDIDRIISRTLAYAIITGVLIGVYAGLVLLATQVLRLHSTVAVAAATLAAAALFNPLRRRVQVRVDRRFNRARYDADQTVTAFADRLKDAVDLDSVRDDLAGVVQQALEPAHVSVWIRPGG